jgi:hypothetical protein
LIQWLEALPTKNFYQRISFLAEFKTLYLLAETNVGGLLFWLDLNPTFYFIRIYSTLKNKYVNSLFIGFESIDEHLSICNIFICLGISDYVSDRRLVVAKGNRLTSYFNQEIPYPLFVLLTHLFIAAFIT